MSEQRVAKIHWRVWWDKKTRQRPACRQWGNVNWYLTSYEPHLTCKRCKKALGIT